MAVMAFRLNIVLKCEAKSLCFSDTDEEELNRLAEAAVSGYSIIEKGQDEVLLVGFFLSSCPSPLLLHLVLHFQTINNFKPYVYVPHLLT